MHSKHKSKYAIHYNSDFSRVIYVNSNGEDIEIPQAVISLLYSAIAEDIKGALDDAIENKIWDLTEIEGDKV